MCAADPAIKRSKVAHYPVFPPSPTLSDECVKEILSQIRVVARRGGTWWDVVDGGEMPEKWKWAFRVFLGLTLTTHQERELKPNDA
jgi:hypothetical protein